MDEDAWSSLWSHNCVWTDLAITETDFAEAREQLRLTADWPRRWSAAAQVGSGEVVVPVRDLESVPVAGRKPVRRFGWHRAQRHRPGLQLLVSTGRHHGCESRAEAVLLQMLDFAGGVTEVLSQPVRLRFQAQDGPREHIPDFFADTSGGRWLIDVRPQGRIEPRDEVAFAATGEVALLLGWGYLVVTGWRARVEATVDQFSAQRRPLTDRLGITESLLTGLAEGLRPFGELAATTIAPPIARAYLLHLLWHRRVGMDLTASLGDHTLITAATSTGQG
ncbi:TnsA-like heteromeric transposase endonuclease subunit [Amycolatopsis samaneae]|uniref:TnsA-like heteromeric transposase endonuclease subunit n=1 Tax=Amycolatopsis samaneae TaxID=664691 RepID=A0ABW5GMS7_9PSEU